MGLVRKPHVGKKKYNIEVLLRRVFFLDGTASNFEGLCLVFEVLHHPSKFNDANHAH